jgi:hypothetical protein
MTEDEHGFFQDHPELQGLEHNADVMRFSEMIDRLDREQLGRALVITDSGPQSAQIRQSDAGTDVEIRPREERETVIGISLAMEPERHLLVFKNGGMLVTEPWGRHDNYKQALDPNEIPLARHREIWKSIPAAINWFSGDGGKGHCAAQVTDSLRSEEDLPRFEEHFDKAIAVASTRKEQQEAARRKGMRTFVDKLQNTIFKRPDMPPGSTEPPRHPPSQ